MKAFVLIWTALAIAGTAIQARGETPMELGEYLVTVVMACQNCHTPRNQDGKLMNDKAFSGGLTFTTPAFEAQARNITPDNETGIGSWTDNEIKLALTEG